MHPVSAFPGPFPHTHIVCRAITDLAGELIQDYNLFQTKCTLFPPGQLNWNKSVQKHWPEAKHFPSRKDAWWLPLWAPPQPYLELWDVWSSILIPTAHCLLRQITAGSQPIAMVFSVWYIPVQSAPIPGRNDSKSEAPVGTSGIDVLWICCYHRPEPQSSAEPVSSQLSHNVCYCWGTQSWSFSILKIFKPSLPLNLFLKESLTSQQLACSLLRKRATVRAVSKQPKYFWGEDSGWSNVDWKEGAVQPGLWPLQFPKLSLGEAWVRSATAPERFPQQPLLGVAAGSTKDLSLHLSVKQMVAVQNSSCGLPCRKWCCKILKVL